MEIIEKLLTPNQYSRPQLKLKNVKKIVLHWTGNPNSKAINNRNYFESLKNKKIYASSHYIIGLDGEIILCIPENEVAYHACQANDYSIGIENCHPDWGGKFNDKTYASLIELCVDLCKRYNLDPLKDIIRHYDVTKKCCPKYYVENPKAWEKLKQDVNDKMISTNTDSTTNDELFNAVSTLIKNGAPIDFNSWKREDLMKLQYASGCVLKVVNGVYKQKYATYKEAINHLIEKNILNTPEVWLDESALKKTSSIASLLIKIAKDISK